MCSSFAVTRKFSDFKTKWLLLVTNRFKKEKSKSILNWEQLRREIWTLSSCWGMRLLDVRRMCQNTDGRESNLTSMLLKFFNWSPHSICRRKSQTSTIRRLRPGISIKTIKHFKIWSQRSPKSGLFSQRMALGTCRKRNPKSSSLSSTRVHQSLRLKS